MNSHNKFAAHLTILWLGAALLVTTAIAQPPRREHDGFFEALREINFPDREMVGMLLWFESVPAEFKPPYVEIGMSKDKLDEMRGLIEGLRSDLFALRPEFPKGTPKEKILERLTDAQAPVEKKITELVRDPQVLNFDRLVGLYVQLRRVSSATNDEVAKRIGLSEQELSDLRDYRTEMMDKLMKENRDKMEDLIRSRQRDKIRKLFKETDESLNAALQTRLTKPQLAALEALKGAAFEFPEQEMRGPRPPRGEPGERSQERPDARGPSDSKGPSDKGPDKRTNKGPDRGRESCRQPCDSPKELTH